MSQDQDTARADRADHVGYQAGSGTWLRARGAAVADRHADAAPGDWFAPGEPAPLADEPTFPLSVARRTAGHSAPPSPARALAGALVAVAGVLLGIGALLWATHPPAGPDRTAGAAALSGHTRLTGATGPAGTAGRLLPAPADTAAAPAANPVPAAPVVVTPLRSTQPARVIAAPRPPLTVLNNSTRPKLADVAAARFRAGGWPVARTGNFRGRIPVTTVYYAAGQYASAQRLQRAYGGLTRVRPRFARLPGHGLTVVLTRSYR